MKFAKTFCAPASTVTLVPTGLPLKLQYNENGLLQKFTIGFNAALDPQYDGAGNVELNYSELFQHIKKFVPQSVSVKGGTTWVYGVMYTDRIPCDEGDVPNCLYGSYISDILNGGKYDFYAGYVTSRAANFNGPLIVRNFLTSNRFNTLPQVVVPVNMTEETLRMAMSPGTFSFNQAFIFGFFIFENMKCRFAKEDLLQINVTKDVKPYVDFDGFLKGKVVSASGKDYIFNYSSIVHRGVTKGCSLLLEKEANGPTTITCTRVGSGVEKVPETSPKEVKCPVCGKLYTTGTNDLPVQCDDPHCLSVLYGTACKMLSTFNLPGITYANYKKLVDKKEIICLTDLLEVEPWKDAEIKTTLATAMYAVIPTEFAPSFEILERFANKCNNTVDSVIYYLQNPLRIETDLDITNPIIKKLVRWLQDPYNVTTLMTIFSRVKIETKVQKFEGSPIFRGTKFAITGRFKRGTYPEIESILRSYAADVVPSIERGEDLPQIILVGSLHDGVSGEMIQKARIHNIPIEEEDDFFVRYEIDQDLAANLL